ncbi:MULTISPECIES: PTS sugar transporter subunit IIA [Streptococcus]|uniref:PTS sugar transporter subunit IIA n=1 Tax=Streptococcus TaxID=1301 RepID=UPI0015C3333E|nr:MULTISPECIES: PTS N-acetylgalactosamine transporter subunit IIA [Streptococcus]MBF0775910.1 PTS N-acetylgalactosamine transporter subunit IIA [Streptococcus sp. 19428wD3_AN2]
MQLVVVAHGEFASGILTSLRLIAGEVEKVVAIDFVEGMSAQEVKDRIKQTISGEKQVLILTDLVGGTPFKTSVELVVEQGQQEIAVLSGLNLAMLLDASFSRLTYEFEPLVQKLVAVAKEGVVDSIRLLAQDDEEDQLFEDGI